MPDRQGATAAPRTAELDALLRRCVQCGLCLPHCATWLASGNEVLSPRGRLVLLGEMLTAGASADAAATADYLSAFDRCIGCRACETACPSGVPFSLLAHGQELAASAAAAAPAAAVPGFVLHRLDTSGWLRTLSGGAGLARAVLRGLLGSGWRRRLAGSGRAGRLARLLGSVPSSPGDGELLRLLDGLCGRPARPAAPLPVRPGADGAAVSFFRGCANDGLLPASSRRLQSLLTATGCRVAAPPGQACCGALAAHAGRPGRAARLRGRNRAAFDRVAAPGTTIVVEAAGCGLALRGYEPGLAHPVRDAVVYLAGRPLPPLGSVPLRVAVHDPCHARHGQGIVAEPRALLAAVPGLRIVQPDEAEVCCGSGGAWGLRHPQLSVALGRRKADLIRATGADLVVTSNPGCLGQIADGLAAAAPAGQKPLPVLPLTDLIWYAAVRTGG